MFDVLGAQDVINAKAGTVSFNRKGKNITLVELTKFSSKLEKKKEDIKVIGTLWNKKKTTSIEGTGSMEGNLIRSAWVQLAQEIGNDGTDAFFDATVTIEDPTSSAGTQSFLLHNLNMDDIPLASLEGDDGIMSWESDFTFEGFKLISSFTGKY